MTNFILQLFSNESTFEYSFPQEILDKNYEIGLVKLDGILEINKKIHINHTNNKLYYIVNVVDKNNNPINEENIVTIPNGKYTFDELIKTINGLLKEDKGFFKASLEDDKVIIDIKNSMYSIDFSRENSLANIFGFSNKVLTYGRPISKIADDSIFICCNLVDDTYLNNEKMNSIYRSVC